VNNKISLVKTVSCICVMAIAMFGSTALVGADYGVKVRYNGNEIYFPDSKPFVDENNRTLVPVRFVAESMNISVYWDEQEKKITLIRNNIEVDLHIGEKHAMVNGRRQELDTSAELYGDRTFVPLRFLSELMGTDIGWDGDNNTVLLSDKISRGGSSDVRAEAGTSIISIPRATVEQAKTWARSKGASDTFISLADIAWRKAPQSGIDPTVVYCQSAKESGFGRFGGVLDESLKNPCGLKKHDGGSDTDKDAHQRFATWDEGIQAQVDHLALYAGAEGYPKENTPDPRHFASLFGIAKSVEALGGKWAGSPTYGNDIVKMMNQVIATPVSE
jgi:hypothetical protein